MLGQSVPTSRLIFDKYDSEGSGYIDVDGLGLLCADQGVQLDAVQLAHALRTLDSTGGGRLSYDDFKVWWASGLALDGNMAPSLLSDAIQPLQGMASTDNLLAQDQLNEEQLLRMLEARFHGGRIYTDGGPMLVAINPYQPLPIYSPEVVAAYAGGGRETLPPHVFRLAADGFAELKLERKSQAVLISGESGAGKTETAKAVLRMLSHLSSTQVGSGVLCFASIVECIARSEHPEYRR